MRDDPFWASGKHSGCKGRRLLPRAMKTGKDNDTPVQSQPLFKGSRNEGGSRRTREGLDSRGAGCQLPPECLPQIRGVEDKWRSHVKEMIRDLAYQEQTLSVHWSRFYIAASPALPPFLRKGMYIRKERTKWQRKSDIALMRTMIWQTSSMQC